MSTQGRNTRRVFSMNNQTRNPPRARGGWRISKDPWERRTPALMRPPLHNTLPLTSRTGKSGLGWKFDPIGRPILSRPLGRRRATNWPAKLASFFNRARVGPHPPRVLGRRGGIPQMCNQVSHAMRIRAANELAHGLSHYLIDQLSPRRDNKRSFD